MPLVGVLRKICINNFTNIKCCNERDINTNTVVIYCSIFATDIALTHYRIIAVITFIFMKLQNRFAFNTEKDNNSGYLE